MFDDPDRENILVGRVISEDDEMVLLEVSKSEDRVLTVWEGDRFYTVMFVRTTKDGPRESWKPWEHV